METDSPRIPVQFRDRAVEDALRARSGYRRSLGQQAARDLGRYYRILADELAMLTFSIEEASLLVEVANGWEVEPWLRGALAVEIRDALILGGAAERWRIPVPGDLLGRIASLTPAQEAAVVDACERYWQTRPEEQGEWNLPGDLRRLGLIRSAG